MSGTREPASRPLRPPRVWALVARLLLRGQSGRLVRGELNEAFRRELERGVPPRQARIRYARNVAGSLWSLAFAAARGLVTHGALLDVKLGARMLRKQPMLAAVAMLALGLGIPAALSVHHVTRVALRPLPVPEGERVLGIRHWSLHPRGDPPSTVHDLEAWRASLHAFQGIGAVHSTLVNVLTGEAGTPPVRASEVTASTFEILRATPVLGRAFSVTDEVPGAPRVVLLSEGLWASRFARDPDIVGRTVRIGGDEHVIVGVMPSSFRFPAADALWLPLRADPVALGPDEGSDLLVFGRLADGASEADADAELAVVTARRAADDPTRFEQLVPEIVGMTVLLMGESDFSPTDPGLLFVHALISLLLLVVCGNVGTLMLARTANRMGELSIRTALGASRRRILVQLFVEALVMALLATGSGLLVAEVFARWLTERAQQLGDLPYWLDLTLDPGIVATALGLAAASAALAGVLPALRATGGGVQANLQRTASGRSTMRFGLGSSLLIVCEVALSVGFLAMGGTVVRSLFQGRDGRLGFEPERYVQGTLAQRAGAVRGDFEGEDAPAEIARRARTQQELLRRLAEDDGVRGVGLGVRVPGADPFTRWVALESEPDDAEWHRVQWSPVDIAYFSGLHRPVLQGRDFTSADLEAGPHGHRTATIVNTGFVAHVLGGRNAIGQRFRLAGGGDPDAAPAWYEIVGVVGPFGTNPLNPSKDEAMYFPLGPGEASPARYLIEVGGDSRAFPARLRQIAASVDPQATIEDATPVSDVIERESSLYRLLFLLQLGLSAIAFLLPLTGLYALMSFTVAQRTREIGIRTALGAQAWRIVSTIGRRAALQLAVGVTLGAGWAWMLLVELTGDSMVMEVDIPLTITVTMAVAAVVGVAACASPTLRGLRIQPTEALRES